MTSGKLLMVKRNEKVKRILKESNAGKFSKESENVILSGYLSERDIDLIIFNMAINSKNIKVINFLLDKVKNVNHDNLLELAYMSDNLVSLKEILRHSKDESKVNDLLVRVCRNGDERALKIILQEGKRFNLDKKMGICGAIVSGNEKVIDMIFEDKKESMEYVKQWIIKNKMDDENKHNAKAVKSFLYKCEIVENKNQMKENIQKRNDRKNKEFKI